MNKGFDYQCRPAAMATLACSDRYGGQTVYRVAQVNFIDGATAATPSLACMKKTFTVYSLTCMPGVDPAQHRRQDYPAQQQEYAQNYAQQNYAPAQAWNQAPEAPAAYPPGSASAWTAPPFQPQPQAHVSEPRRDQAQVFGAPSREQQQAQPRKATVIGTPLQQEPRSGQVIVPGRRVPPPATQGLVAAPPRKATDPTHTCFPHRRAERLFCVPLSDGYGDVEFSRHFSDVELNPGASFSDEALACRVRSTGKLACRTA